MSNQTDLSVYQPLSGNSLNIRAMVDEFGPITHIDMNPRVIETIESVTQKPGVKTYLGLPVVETEMVNDWWPLWNHGLNIGEPS